MIFVFYKISSQCKFPDFLQGMFGLAFKLNALLRTGQGFQFAEMSLKQ